RFAQQIDPRISHIRQFHVVPARESRQRDHHIPSNLVENRFQRDIILVHRSLRTVPRRPPNSQIDLSFLRVNIGPLQWPRSSPPSCPQISLALVKKSAKSSAAAPKCFTWMSWTGTSSRI